MMMPAKFSVVTENEMTYVIGGGASAWGEFGSTLAKNAWTIVGNNFVSGLVGAVLGTMFGGSYEVGGVFSALGTFLTKTNNQAINGLNSILKMVGVVAAVDQLTNYAVSSVVGRWTNSSTGEFWDMGIDRWISSVRPSNDKAYPNQWPAV